jgi:hypothetical protein
MRLDQRPSHQWIACVALSLSLTLRSSNFGPHLVPRRFLSTTIMSQSTEITQFISS